ncbi:SRPBCC family protein [Polymorphospora sp. NPDC051019]|uniref:SRPBCC family protein n=1 Tax=Polymorphospora sp. NPDC051019 TaxID=3155725 RepID=UPI00341F56D8
MSERERPMAPATDPTVTARIDDDATGATLAEVAGRWVLTMTRALPHPVDRVWPKLTEPDQLRTWSPVGPDRPLDSVGPATSRETPQDDPEDAEVLVCDPPRELVHRWGSHLLRWTLAPTPDGSLLTLEHTFDEHPGRGMYAAGWHVALAVLATVFDGHEVDRVVGEAAREYGWSTLRQRYDESLG